MFKVISNSSVSKSFKERFDSSDSFKIRFIEETSSHRTRYIEKYSNSFLRFPGNNGLEVFLINRFLNIFTSHISRHQVQIHSFFLSSKHIIDVMRLSNVFISTNKHSQLAFLRLQSKIGTRLIFDLQRLMNFHINIVIQIDSILID